MGYFFYAIIILLGALISAIIETFASNDTLAK